MINDLINSISLGGTATSILSLGVTLISLLLNMKIQKKQIENAKRSKHEVILASADIKKVGDYLYEDIGDFRVSDYVSNPKVRAIVDSYITKLDTFLNSDELNVEKQTNPSEEVKNIQTVHFISEGQSLLDELVLGETWNVLAKLRRSIELNLKEIAEKKGLRLDNKRGAGLLLKMLYNKQLISYKTYNDLGYAIMVCNKAIHGEDISSEQAKEAIFHANRGMEEIIEVNK